MRKTLLSLMVATGAMMVSCGNEKMKTTALENKDGKEGFSLLQPNLVKLTKVDPITEDISVAAGRYVRTEAGNGVLDKTNYYFNLNDSSVVITRYSSGNDGQSSYDDGLEISATHFISGHGKKRQKKILVKRQNMQTAFQKSKRINL